jgi:hypothetical protein
LFSLFVSGEELAVCGSVGDDGKGAKKCSDNSESGARVMDDGTVVTAGSGCGGGGGGGRLGMEKASCAILF